MIDSYVPSNPKIPYPCSCPDKVTPENLSAEFCREIVTKNAPNRISKDISKLMEKILEKICNYVNNDGVLCEFGFSLNYICKENDIKTRLTREDRNYILADLERRGFKAKINIEPTNDYEGSLYNLYLRW